MCPRSSPLHLSPNKHVAGTSDASGTGPGPGSSGFWSPPCPGILALGAVGWEGNIFCLLSRHDASEQKPHQLTSLVLSWCFPVCLCSPISLLGRNTETWEPERPGFTSQSCLFQAAASAAKRSHLTGLVFPHPDCNISCGVVGRMKLENELKCLTKPFSLSLFFFGGGGPCFFSALLFI